MKPSPFIISLSQYLCFASVFVQMFICFGCKSSNSVPSNRSVNERLSSIEIPAFILHDVYLQDVVDFLNFAIKEHERPEGEEVKKPIVFECSHSLLKRKTESLPFKDSLPLGATSEWSMMQMLDYINEICLLAHVDFVIIGNRGVFVERKTSAQASKSGAE